MFRSAALFLSVMVIVSILAFSAQAGKCGVVNFYTADRPLCFENASYNLTLFQDKRSAKCETCLFLGGNVYVCFKCTPSASAPTGLTVDICEWRPNEIAGSVSYCRMNPPKKASVSWAVGDCKDLEGVGSVKLVSFAECLAQTPSRMKTTYNYTPAPMTPTPAPPAQP